MSRALSSEISAALAGRARAQGILVNVEDEPLLCDFHVPATVRRGDLLLTVSSAGRSPGLVAAWSANGCPASSAPNGAGG